MVGPSLAKQSRVWQGAPSVVTLCVGRERGRNSFTMRRGPAATPSGGGRTARRTFSQAVDQAAAMAFPISVEQLNGETLELEVEPETRIEEVKQQIRKMHMWEDKVKRATTVVEVILGDKKLRDEETVGQVGLSAGSRVSAMFRPNLARCSERSALGADLDADASVIVEIPNTETDVRLQAFTGCTRLGKVIIPCSVTRIGDLAFCGCISLTEVTIPDSVTHIGGSAFKGCSSLTDLTMPNSVTHICNYAFSGCSSLTRLTIPDSVIHVGDGAFGSCSSLIELTMPGSMTRIEHGAFAGCSSLTGLTIPNSVTHVGNWAFLECSALTKVLIPTSVTQIGDGAFQRCSSLSDVTIPSSVTHIGDWAFEGCRLIPQSDYPRLPDVDWG